MSTDVIETEGIATEIPKVKDLLDLENVQSVIVDADGLGLNAIMQFFTAGATKAPIKKQTLHRFVASSAVIGEMKCVERLMSFLENAEIMDGFDPNHDFVQSLYGELCMYLLKLDKMLLANYGIKSSVNTKDIEKRGQQYLERFFHRREKINKLQEMLKSDDTAKLT